MSEDSVSLREMFTELRRLEDSVRYFENAVLRQKIAIEEHLRMLQARAESLAPVEEDKVDRRCGRKAATMEEIHEAIRVHGYNGAALALGCTVQNLRNRVSQAKHSDHQTATA